MAFLMRKDSVEQIHGETRYKEYMINKLKKHGLK